MADDGGFIKMGAFVIRVAALFRIVPVCVAARIATKTIIIRGWFVNHHLLSQETSNNG